MPIPVASAFAAVLLKGLARLIRSRAGAWIAAAMLSLGVAFGVSEVVMDPLVSFVTAQMNAGSSTFVVWAGFLKFDIAVSIVMSAAVYRATFRGLFLVRKTVT